MNVLFEPLLTQYQTGIHVYIKGEIEWCYMAIANIIGDLPEIACYCLTSKSPKSRHPCPKCLVENCNLSNISLTKEQMELRTHKNMKKALDNNQWQECSLVPLFNIFWKHR